MLISTLPVVPGATELIGPLPAPNSTAPAVNVVLPVPPNTGLNAVVNPEICVMSELLPEAAADNADLAAAAVLPPVPPDATGNAELSPVMVPPVTATALAFCVAMVPTVAVAPDPSPRFVLFEHFGFYVRK